MLTKKAKYALIAVLHLARRYGEGPILINELAEREGIPKKFLETILLELKNHGFLQSKKGKGGGYYLRKGPDEITIGDIVRTIDGPLAPVPCVSKTAYQPCEECRDERVCGIRLVMKNVRDAIANVLDRATLKDIVRQMDRK